MDWNPLRSFLTQRLRSSLERFVVNIDLDSLGLTSEATVLRDLELRQDAFPRTKTGLRLKRGFVKELRISIPSWTALLSLPVQIEISTCEIVFNQEDYYAADVVPETSLERVEGGEQEDSGSWLKDVLLTMLANATIELSNVVIKLERNETCATLVWKSLRVFTCEDKTWEKKTTEFVTKEPFGQLYKMAVLDGLTIDVQHFKHADEGMFATPIPPHRIKGGFVPNTYEVPLLKKFNAKARFCIHLTPRGATMTDRSDRSDRQGRLDRPDRPTSAPLHQTHDRSSNSVNSLPGLLSGAFQRVSSVVGNVAATTTAVKTTRHDQSDDSDGGEDLHRDRDPFLGCEPNPWKHPSAVFFAAVDIWAERMELSVSEKQLAMLEEMIRKPIVLLGITTAVALPLPVQPLPSLVPPPPLAAPQSTIGWSTWAWQTMGGGDQEPDQEDSFLGGIWRGTFSNTNDNLAVQKNSPNLITTGVRVDRFNLALMIHTNNVIPDRTPRHDEQSSQTSGGTAGTRKKMVPVNTPKGIVFVEDEEVVDPQQYEEDLRRRKSIKKLVTFMEISAREIIVTADLQIGWKGKAAVPHTVELALDVGSMEATRWNDIYADLGHQTNLEEKRDVVFSWIDTLQTETRCLAPHPHSKWNLWAHPATRFPPAIRVYLNAKGISKKSTSSKRVLIDVALAPVLGQIDGLLAEGTRRFLEYAKMPYLPKASKKSQSTDASVSASSFQILLTLASARLEVKSSKESLALEIQRVEGRFKQSRKMHGSCSIQAIELIVSPGSKRILRLTELTAFSSSSSKKQDSFIRVDRAAFGLSQHHFSSGLNAVSDAFGPIMPFPGKRFFSAENDSIPIVCDVLINNVAVRKRKNFEDTNDANLTPLSLVDVNVDSLSCVVIKGHVRDAFVSKSPHFLHFALVVRQPQQQHHLLESAVIKLAAWELDWDGALAMVEWTSRIASLVREVESLWPVKSAIMPLKLAEPTRPPPPTNSFRILLDLEPSVLTIAALGNDYLTTEFRFPMISIQALGNSGQTTTATWSATGARAVVLSTPVISHFDANGTASLTSQQDHATLSLDTRLSPITIELNGHQVLFLTKRLEDAFVHLYRNVHFKSKTSEHKSLSLVSAKYPLPSIKLKNTIEGITFKFSCEGADSAAAVDSQIVANLTVASHDDVQSMVGVSINTFQIDYSRDASGAGTTVEASFTSLRVWEESAGVTWNLLGFRNTPTQSNAFNLQINSISGRSFQGSLRIEAFVATLRSLAWDTPLALMEPLVQCFVAVDKIISKTRKTIAKPHDQAPATSSPATFDFALTVAASSEILVPLTSANKNSHVECIFVRMKSGIQLSSHQIADVQPTAEFGFGRFSQTHSINAAGVNECLYASAPGDDLWSTIEPTISSSPCTSIVLPLNFCFANKADIFRIRLAMMVLKEKSVLRGWYDNSSSSFGQTFCKPGHALPAPAAVASKPIKILDLPALSLSIPHLVVKVFVNSASEFFDFSLLGFRAASPAASILKNTSSLCSFDSLMISSTPDDCYGKRTLLSFHAQDREEAFVLNTDATLLDIPGSLLISIDAVTLSALKDAIVLPVLPASKPSRHRPMAQLHSHTPKLKSSRSNLKVLLPRVEISASAKPQGPMFVIDMKEGFASINESGAFDATLAGLRVSFGLTGSKLLETPVVPRTDVRAYGVLGESCSSFSLDFSNIDVGIGFEHVAVAVAIASEFASSLNAVQNDVPNADCSSSSNGNNNHARLSYLGKEHEATLTQVFRFLLDKKMDPEPGQLAFSDAVLKDEDGIVHFSHLLPHAPCVEEDRGPEWSQSDSESSSSSSDEWVGFRFRFCEIRKFTKLRIMGPIRLDDAFANEFEKDQMWCQLLYRDVIRGRWVTALDFFPAVAFTKSTTPTATQSTSFTDVFTSWMSSDVQSTSKTSGPGDRTEHRSPDVRFPSDLEGATTWWIRWKLSPTSVLRDIDTPLPRDSASPRGDQRLAISNALAQALAITSISYHDSTLDASITIRNFTLRWLHRCYAYDDSSSASDLVVLQVPRLDFRAFAKQKEASVAVFSNTELSMDVLRVADFTKCSILKDAKLDVEFFFKRNQTAALDLHLGNWNFRLDPESILVASHAVRGLVRDFAKPRITARVLELLSDLGTEKPANVNPTRATLRSACSCARLVVVNGTGGPIFFGKDESECVLIESDEYMAYSWSRCLCGVDNTTSSDQRSLRFALCNRQGHPSVWCDTLNVNEIGLFRRSLKADKIVPPMNALLDCDEECDMWIGVQAGDSAIETIVVLHASDCAINTSGLDIEICPMSSAPASSMAASSSFGTLPRSTTFDQMDEMDRSGASLFVSIPKRNVVSKKEFLHPALDHNVSARFMVGKARRRGWIFRMKGGGLNWSRVCVPDESSSRLLVEMPGPYPGWAWCTSKKVKFGLAQDEFWTELEIFPSYLLRNDSPIPLTLAVRQEHRWESLQYALQSVAMNTTPPGPLPLEKGLVGEWLALPPRSVGHQNGVPTNFPADRTSQHDDEHDAFAMSATCALNSTRTSRRDDESVSSTTPHYPFPLTSPTEKRGAVGAGLAADLLRSVSPILASSPLPKLSTVLGGRKLFSSQLDSREENVSNLTMLECVPGLGSIALNVDPREAHALLIVDPRDHRVLGSPLRLHPVLAKSDRLWERFIEIPTLHDGIRHYGDDDDDDLDKRGIVARVEGGHDIAPCVIGFSPFVTINNSSSRALLIMPLARDATWMSNEKPTRVGPGESQSLFYECDGISFAASFASGQDEERLMSLDWTPSIRVLDLVQAQLKNEWFIVPVPLARGAEFDSSQPFCGWVEALTAVSTAMLTQDLKATATFANNRRLAFRSTFEIFNVTPFDLNVVVSALDAKDESRSLHLHALGGRQSLPGYRHAIGQEQPKVLTACFSMALNESSISIRLPNPASVEVFSAQSPSPALFLLPRISLDSGKMAELIMITFSRHANGCLVATLRLQSQPRFILKNSSSSMQTFDVLCAGSKSLYEPSIAGVRLYSGCSVPFHWDLCTKLHFVDDGFLLTPNFITDKTTAAAAAARPFEDQSFFTHGKEERFMIRLVLSGDAHDKTLKQNDCGFHFIDSTNRSKQGTAWSPTISTKEGSVYVMKSSELAVRTTVSSWTYGGATLIEFTDVGSSAAVTMVDKSDFVPIRKSLPEFRLRSSAQSLMAFVSNSMGENIILLGCRGLRGNARVSYVPDQRSVDKACSSAIGKPYVGELQYIRGQVCAAAFQIESLSPLRRKNIKFKNAEDEVLRDHVEFPVVFSFDPNHLRQCINVRFGFWDLPKKSNESMFFEYLDLTLARAVVNLEDVTMKKWAHILVPVVAGIAAEWKPPVKPSKAVVVLSTLPSSRFFVCDSFSISELEFVLTVRATNSSIFVGFDRTPIRFWPVFARRIRCSAHYARSELAASYLADVLLSSPALLGSLDILGNPTGLIRSFAAGLYDLVAIPLSTLRTGHGPGAVLRGVAHGWLGLIAHVADGTLTSFGGISAAIARSLHLTVHRKSQYVVPTDIRDQRRLATSESSEIQDAGWSFGSLVRGVAGMVVKPAESAADLVAHAAKGMAKSVGSHYEPQPWEILDDQSNDGVQRSIVNVDRMIEWRFCLDDVFAARGFVADERVFKSALAGLQVVDDEEGVVRLISCRAVLSSLGLTILFELCFLHGGGQKIKMDDNRQAGFMFFPWDSISSVQESLVQTFLAVFVVHDEQEVPPRSDQVRLVFSDSETRKEFVRETISRLELRMG